MKFLGVFLLRCLELEFSSSTWEVEKEKEMDILRLSFSWEGGWGGGAWEVSGRDGERESFLDIEAKAVYMNHYTVQKRNFIAAYRFFFPWFEAKVIYINWLTINF